MCAYLTDGALTIGPEPYVYVDILCYVVFLFYSKHCVLSLILIQGFSYFAVKLMLNERGES